MTIAQIIEIATARKISPCIMTPADLEVLANFALKRLNVTNDALYLASITGTLDRQTYPIFDSTDTEFGVCADAVDIRDVYFNPHGDISNDIFNPQWPLYQELFASNSIFNRPADIVIYRMRLNNWREAFGQQSWEIENGAIGQSQAVLKLHPAPKSDNVTVYISYTKRVTLSILTETMEEPFWLWLEHYIAEAMANYYSQTAGADLLGFATGTAALNYWRMKSDKKYEQALAKTHGLHGEVERTY